MFLYHKWLELPIPTRIKIASEFGIIKKGSTHVANNEVVSDGYSIKDVETTLTSNALQEYVKCDETDMAVLWDMFISKVEAPDVPIVHEANVVATTPIIVVPKNGKETKNK